MLLNAVGVLLLLVPVVVLPLIYTRAGRGISERGYVALMSVGAPMWGLGVVGDLKTQGASFWLVAKLISVCLIGCCALWLAIDWRLKQRAQGVVTDP